MSIVAWATVKNAIADWVYSIVALPAHWAGQDEPRPAYPYVLLDIVSGPVREHHDSAYVVDDVDDIRVAVRGDRAVTFSVEPIVSFEGVVYSHASDAHALAEELRSSLERDAIRDTLRAAGISVLDSSGTISNRRTVLDAGFLSRAGFDVLTGLAALYMPATKETAIERVEIESTIDEKVSDDLYGEDGDPTPYEE